MGDEEDEDEDDIGRSLSLGPLAAGDGGHVGATQPG